jgi:hypothetical protein
MRQSTFLFLATMLLCGFTYGYKNNPQTGKPDMVVVGTVPGDITGFSAYTSNHKNVIIGTANGLSLAGQVLSLQAATNSQPGALTAADHTSLSTAVQPAGNVATATKLQTARTIGITGPITWTSPGFDGSGNVTAAATVASQTGTGNKFVMDTSPTIITPNITTSVTIAGTTPLTGYKEGTWTPTPTNLTVVGTPTYTGTYTRIGRRVCCTLAIQSTGSTSAAGNSTYFSLPYNNASNEAITGVNLATGAMLNTGVGGYVYINLAWAPSWTTSNWVILSFQYNTNDPF